MASFVYNSYKLKLIDNSTKIDLDNDTIKLALTTSSYTPDQDAHNFFDDITNEISVTGYTAGGFTLASTTATQDDTDNEAVFDAADISQAITGSATFRYGILYKSTGNSATSPLIALIDFATNKNVDNETLQITFAAEGILNFT